MDLREFEELLCAQHEFPGPYTIKFVVPSQQVPRVTSLLADAEVATRPSRTGKYVSVSLSKTFASAGEVIRCYQSAANIEGIISL